MVTHWLEQFRVISVKNTSGEDCPAFGLLAVTGSELRGKRQILLGAKPSTTFYREYVVNGPTVIKAGKVGECYVSSGPQWIKYDTLTPAAGEGWGPKPGQWTASKGFPGITVEGIKDAGRYLLLGTLHEVGTLLCLAPAGLGIGAHSSSYTIQSGDPSSNANAGFTTLPTIHLGVAIDAGKLFIAHWLNNCWVGLPWECNDA